MTSTIALREDHNLTIEDLIASKTVAGLRSDDLSLDTIRVQAQSEDPTIVLGQREVPMTETGLSALADALQVPAPFFNRLGDPERRGGLQTQAELLTMVLGATPATVVRAEYTDSGLLGITPPKDRVRPVQLAQVAQNVVGEGAVVQRVKDDGATFGFDIHVPFDSGNGVGGDPDSLVEVPQDLLSYSWTTNLPVRQGSQVGDLTAGGIRMFQDVKHGLAPTVTPYMFRLACTNGMESMVELPRIDLRGNTVDDVLAELEDAAQRAFGAVEEQIRHFYDMRERRLENPERFLTAAAQERGLSARSLEALLAQASTLGEDASEFDAINLITNLANRAQRDGTRLLLERAGGGMVSDHAVRCQTCNHMLLN